MTRFGMLATLLAASALGGTAALAQSTAPQTTPPASTGTPSTTAPAAPTAAASYTDADIDQFAGAALAVQKIQQDASVADADKQTKMASAVTSSGLTPEKFNAIATASQSDPALMKRIQTAAAAKMPAAGASPAASAGASGSAGATGASGSAGMSGSAHQ